MQAIEAPAVSVQNRTEIPETTLLAGLGLTSFAALLLELSLTRLFSVVLVYHFAFLAISVALLGLGAGGVAAYVGRRRLAATSTRTIAARASALQAAASVVALLTVMRTQVSLVPGAVG